MVYLFKIYYFRFIKSVVLGNPILCNCNLRPLLRWLGSQLSVKNEWKNTTCIDYESSTNKTLLGMSEQEVYCDTISLSQNREFEVTPDVKFRDVTR